MSVRGHDMDQRFLLAAAQAGDERAFARLVEPYRHALEVHCYRMLGSGQDAEDLAQEALLRAWRALGRFEPRVQFQTWLYRIATNACLDGRARGAAERGRDATDAATPGDEWRAPDRTVLPGDGRPRRSDAHTAQTDLGESPARGDDRSASRRWQLDPTRDQRARDRGGRDRGNRRVSGPDPGAAVRVPGMRVVPCRRVPRITTPS